MKSCMSRLDAKAFMDHVCMNYVLSFQLQQQGRDIVEHSHVPAVQLSMPQLHTGSPMMHGSPGLIWHAAHQRTGPSMAP